MERRSHENRPSDDALAEALRRVGGGDFSFKFEDTSGVLARMFNTMVDGLKERDRIRDTFGRYMTRQVSDAILRGDVKLGGERRIATMLIAEVREYDGLAETREPERLVEIVNRYLEASVQCVMANDGTIDKFDHGGRGITVIFGSPVKDEHHAAKAVACGVQLRDRMRGFERAEPAIHMDIGIATGPIIAGNIGATGRMEYTALGPAALRAERLKDEARKTDAGLLVSPPTAEAAGQGFKFRRVSDLAYLVDG